MLNPEPENEHLGDDDDDLGAGQPNVEPSDDLHEVSSSDSEYDHDSDSDYEDDEGDEMMQDIVPPHNPEVVYDKDDPPMAVGTIYPSMSEFKLALASHAIKYEFEYNIEKSDPGRYRVYCSRRSEGCRWRIHASKMGDDQTIKVIVTWLLFNINFLLLLQYTYNTICAGEEESL